jgi:Beta-galactosidase, domain 2/Beta-galactosidase, domain 3/Beta-galactosidase jelly roll domain/Glycosyl hydrolases family 35
MPWGGQFYDNCIGEHDPAFADVYYKNNIAQRVTLLSLYMAYGGTSWGHSAAPVVYTSYDYSAPLRETREIQDKFKQTKLTALFTRVSKSLLKADIEDHGEGKSVDNTAIYTWILRNPDNHAGFYILQQTDSRSKAKQKASMKLRTNAGVVSVPEVELNGRQSKIVVTDYRVGSTNLLYSSADILTYGLFQEAIVVIYLNNGQRGEFGLKVDSSVTFKAFGAKSDFTSEQGKSSTGETFVRYHWTQPHGQVVVKFSNGIVFLLLDIPTAWKFFAPASTVAPNLNATDHVFVIGPYLVRDTTVSGNEVRITGDWNKHTDIEVFGLSKDSQIVWNGQHLKSTPTEYGSIIASIAGIEGRVVKLPELISWNAADSLPEKSRTFDDSKFTDCSKMATSKNVARPLRLPVLYSSDYGFHSGIKIYRGYFNGKSAKRANITVQGGLASGWSAWLNGHYINSSLGDPKASATSLMLDISPLPLFNEANVLTIVADYHGHDETNAKPAGPLNPRGVLGASLFEDVNGTTKELNFSKWKLQGNAGGEIEIDSVRGPMNEGGLYGERLGWHLPGFDTTSWRRESPLQGLKQAGVTWYMTTFDLNVDPDLDVPLGLELDAPPGTAARIQIFING